MPRRTDGSRARERKPNKPQNKTVNERKNKSLVFIQRKRKRAKNSRLNALKRKPRIKERKQNAKSTEKARSERTENGRNGTNRQKDGANREQIHHERRDD